MLCFLSSSKEVLLQTMLLKTLLKVETCIQISSALSYVKAPNLELTLMHILAHTSTTGTVTLISFHNCQVATKYKTVLMVNAFPSSFVEPLLRMSLAKDPGIRCIVQEILHTLIDRHDNMNKLKHVT